MNPDTNRFEVLTEELSKKVKQLTVPYQLLRPNGEPVPRHWTQFQMDELVVIKNYTFRVKYIGESAILFEPVRPSDILGGEEIA